MIDRKTVLILGAGASAPYGLPLGSGLRENILKMTASDLSALPIGPGQSRPRNLAADFLTAFRRSNAYSIDAFLARRPEFVDLGKHAIAAALLPKESSQRLLDSDPDDHWYRYLLHAMDAPWERFQDNQISFITFNYDRSLEVFLMVALAHRYGKSFEVAREMVATFPIVHVYGSLGSLVPATPNFVPYGADQGGYIGTAAAGLRIIDEGRDDSQEFNQAKQLIAEAEALCFLGFSFDKTNVRRLGGHEIGAGGRFLFEGGWGHKEFAATAFELSAAEVRAAAQSISIRNGLADIRDQMLDMRCLKTLRHTLILG